MVRRPEPSDHYGGPAVQAHRMTEDDLLSGLTDALTLGGWRWTHILNSRGVTMGYSGLPDIIAAHPSFRVNLALELKDDKGQPTPDQVAWLHALHDKPTVAKIVRPDDYDLMLRVILAGTRTGT